MFGGASGRAWAGCDVVLPIGPGHGDSSGARPHRVASVCAAAGGAL